MKTGNLRLWIFIVSLISIFMYPFISLASYGIYPAIVALSGGAGINVLVTFLPIIMSIISLIGLLKKDGNYRKTALVMTILTVIDLFLWIGFVNLSSGQMYRYSYYRYRETGPTGLVFFLTFLFIIFLLFTCLLITIGRMDTETGYAGLLASLKNGRGKPVRANTRPTAAPSGNTAQKQPVDTRVRNTSASEYNSRRNTPAAGTSANGRNTAVNVSGRINAYQNRGTGPVRPSVPAPEPEPAAMPAPGSTAAKKICPGCGREMKDVEIFCARCGTKYVEPQENICSVCGTVNLPDSRFCNNCGSKLLD